MILFVSPFFDNDPYIHIIKEHREKHGHNRIRKVKMKEPYHLFGRCDLDVNTQS